MKKIQSTLSFILRLRRDKKIKLGFTKIQHIEFYLKIVIYYYYN